jgi:hypothetical protein
MLNRLFPKQFDNSFQGSRLAIWLLIPILLLRAIIGFNSMAFTRSVAMTADGIPLDKFGVDAAQTVIALFALLGLLIFLFALLGVVVLIRYRAMIPFMYLVLLAQQLGNKALLLVYPVVRSGQTTSGSAVVLVILTLTFLGFVLSLVNTAPSRAES